VLVAWGYTRSGERVLLEVDLGQRERYEDWLEMGRGLVRRSLRALWLSVADGAPGLVKAVEELWSDSDRQRCTVHRLRDVLAKLPKKREIIDRIRPAYWAALDQAGSAADGESRLRTLV
jgi:transposase-like protein